MVQLSVFTILLSLTQDFIHYQSCCISLSLSTCTPVEVYLYETGRVIDHIHLYCALLVPPPFLKIICLDCCGCCAVLLACMDILVWDLFETHLNFLWACLSIWPFNIFFYAMRRCSFSFYTYMLDPLRILLATKIITIICSWSDRCRKAPLETTSGVSGRLPW